MIEFILYRVFQTYNYLFHEVRDPRSKDFLLSGPGSTLAILTTYLIFCTKLGPWFMEHRKPFKLKNVIFVYNVFQVGMSIYLFKLGSSYILSPKFSWKCETMDFSHSPRALMVVSDCWWLFFAKLTELIETVFFVLRKKDRQVSFLHLYHHTLMVWCTWLGVNYFPGGQPIFQCTVNALVHINMYSYYLISGVTQNYRKYLLWKKFTTAFQIVQFVLVFIHFMYGICTGCPYPMVLSLTIIFNCILFMYLFGSFYYNNYTKSLYNNSAIKND